MWGLTLLGTVQWQLAFTVEIVILEHKIFFSTSMFGISFWKNGEYHKSDCIFMLINYMTTYNRKGEVVT